jgi:transketolase
MMRSLPNLTVVCPGDAVEVRLALQTALKMAGPVYLRIGKKGEPIVHDQDPEFEIGKGIIVTRGEHVCLLSTGNMLPVAVEAANRLSSEGWSAQVVSMHTVKPLDHKLLHTIFETFQVVVTLEEHSRIGGFGAGVAEWMADNARTGTALLRLGTPDAFIHRSGNQIRARELAGLDAAKVAALILEKLHA